VALRIDDGEGRRQRPVGLVMIGDDQIDTELARLHRGVGPPDAAVH
jgi:hypothetical protein